MALFSLQSSDFLFLQDILHFTANNVSATCKQGSYNYYKMPLRVGRSYSHIMEKQLDDDGDSNEPGCKF